MKTGPFNEDIKWKPHTQEILDSSFALSAQQLATSLGREPRRDQNDQETGTSLD